jgi:hypothetical protein
VEARAVSFGGVVRPFYRAGEGGGHRAMVSGGGINARRSALKEKKGEGQWGGEVIRWGKPGGRRACHGGGRRTVGWPGRQRATAPDRGGSSILLDRRKEKAGWAFWAERLLGMDCAAGPS